MSGKKRLVSYGNEAVALYLMHLISCALKGVKADEKPSDVDFDELFSLACKNSVEAAAAYGMDTLDNKPPSELYDKWMHRLDLSVYHEMGFAEERELLFSRLSELKISHMPLKGLRFAELYPMPGMRFMSDMDVLFGYTEEKSDGKYGFAGKDAEQRAELSEKAKDAADALMKDMGYAFNEGDETELSYVKKPYYHIEMHRLITNEETHFDYYDDPFLMAKRSADFPYRFEFAPEDEYVYYIAHTYKHFVGGGCGVRCLADIYVFLERHGAEMDRAYVDGELKKLGAFELAKSLEALAYALFSENGALGDSDKELLLRLLYSGTYGNAFVRIDNKIEKKINREGVSPARARAGYIFRRIFPSFEEIKDYRPLVYKFKILYPFYVIFRLIVKPFASFKFIKEELKIVFRKKEKKK